MLRLSLEYVKPGMITSRNIYNANGSLLLGKDHLLDEQFIRRLSNLNIDAVFVQNPFCDIEPAEEVLHETTRVEAIRFTQKAFENFKKTQNLNLVGIHQSVQKIIGDIMANRHVLIHLADIRVRDDYTFGHSINVCLVATIIGLKLRLSELQLTELATGAVLHDVGMMLLSPALVNKREALSSDDWAILKSHADLGFGILRNQGAVSLVSAHIAFQHHEKWDGSGYPRGISGENIHRYARIVAVADMYDAMTSERAYRPAMLPHEAYEVILASRGSKLDPEFVDIFLENVALFPEGTMVLLDTGEIGVVVHSLPKLQARPIVKIVANALGQKVDEGREVDLTKELTRFIVKVYKAEEIAVMELD
ncbi:MAG: HD-GYP domain-containing protein [Negativicutes bacterium]|nr:HD-GYP domain-containing protein [Negativicutes bacterium]